MAASAVAPMTAKEKASPQVILLGTVHDLHFKPASHYSLTDLRHEIEALHPDAICGEITPEAYGGNMEGYFPPEAAFLAEIAPSLHAKFIPSDWRIALAWQTRAENMLSSQIEARAKEIEMTQRKLLQKNHAASLFDNMHNEALLALADEEFERIYGENTNADIAAGG